MSESRKFIPTPEQFENFVLNQAYIQDMTEAETIEALLLAYEALEDNSIHVVKICFPDKIAKEDK